MRVGWACVGLLSFAVAVAGCTSAPSSSGPTAAATEKVAPGDIPDTQAFVTETGPSKAWTIKVPEGWSRRSIPGGLDFTDKFNQVAVVERSASSAPTVASVRSQEVPALAAAHRGFRLKSVRTFKRSGGPGVRIDYEADSVKDPVTGKVHRDAGEEYIFFRSPHEVVVTLSGAVGADNVDPWRVVTDSFRWAR